MDETVPTVSIIVPTYRRLDMLKKSLSAIGDMQGDVLEVLIVHRPNEDEETADWLRTYAPDHSNWRTLSAEEPGVVFAINLGIESAKGEIIAIFDDDALPRPDWLLRVLEHYKDDSVAAVGGRDLVHRSDGSTMVANDINVAGVRTFWGNLIGNHHLVTGPAHYVDVIKGCNWSLRRKALGTLHLDGRLLGRGAQVGNEAWLCLLLRQGGWHITLDPQALIDHYPAERSDIDRDMWSYQRCYQDSHNNTALLMAFASLSLKLRYILFMMFVGKRHCPGFYFIAHSLLKRPRALPRMFLGGWAGFLHGFRLARELRKSPPGYPAPSPSSSSVNEPSRS